MDKWETDETYENYDLADMITDMFLAYNVIMHWPIALTGIVIIVKEVVGATEKDGETVSNVQIVGAVSEVLVATERQPKSDSSSLRLIVSINGVS